MLRIINEVSEMSHAVSPAEVTFYSDGLKIAGYLYSPDGWKPGGAQFGGSKPEDYAVFLRSEVAKWGRIVKAAGITPE